MSYLKFQHNLIVAMIQISIQRTAGMRENLWYLTSIISSNFIIIIFLALKIVVMTISSKKFPQAHKSSCFKINKLKVPLPIIHWTITATRKNWKSNLHWKPTKNKATSYISKLGKLLYHAMYPTECSIHVHQTQLCCKYMKVKKQSNPILNK